MVTMGNLNYFIINRTRSQASWNAINRSRSDWFVFFCRLPDHLLKGPFTKLLTYAYIVFFSFSTGKSILISVISHSVQLHVYYQIRYLTQTLTNIIKKHKNNPQMAKINELCTNGLDGVQSLYTYHIWMQSLNKLESVDCIKRYPCWVHVLWRLQESTFGFESARKKSVD